jgi:renal tumor antigen
MHKYRLISKKGEGTFSEVLKAQSIKNGQYTAIKCMKNHFDSIEQVNNLREIQALQRLSPNPHVVKLYEVLYDQPTGRLALVFELMNMNMYELIRGRRHYLPENAVKLFMYQLIKAMDHMHRNGIFHRDIKPENILIRDDLLKVADFGSCRGIYSKQPYTEYISTRWYRAPECLLTDGYYGYKMDMWGVGCVMFEVIALFPLFPGTNELDQITKVHKVLGSPSAELLAKFKEHAASHIDFNFPQYEATGIAKMIPHTSAECVDLIEKLIDYDPDTRLSARQALRHPWFRELREAVKMVHRGMPAPSQKDGSGTARSERSRSTHKTKGKKDRARARERRERREKEKARARGEANPKTQRDRDHRSVPGPSTKDDAGALPIGGSHARAGAPGGSHAGARDKGHRAPAGESKRDDDRKHGGGGDAAAGLTHHARDGGGGHAGRGDAGALGVSGSHAGGLAVHSGRRHGGGGGFAQGSHGGGSHLGGSHGGGSHLGGSHLVGSHGGGGGVYPRSLPKIEKSAKVSPIKKSHNRGGGGGDLPDIMSMNMRSTEALKIDLRRAGGGGEGTPRQAKGSGRKGYGPGHHGASYGSGYKHKHRAAAYGARGPNPPQAQHRKSKTKRRRDRDRDGGGGGHAGGGPSSYMGGGGRSGRGSNKHKADAGADGGGGSYSSPYGQAYIQKQRRIQF